jgi:hypothetical protein
VLALEVLGPPDRQQALSGKDGAAEDDRVVAPRHGQDGDLPGDRQSVGRARSRGQADGGQSDSSSDVDVVGLLPDHPEAVQQRQSVAEK